MTTVKAGASYPIRMDQLQISSLMDGEITQATSSLIQVNFSDTFYATFTGHFTYDGFGNLAGGTLNGVHEVNNGEAVFDISHFSCDALTFVGWVESDATLTAFSTILSGKDKFFGSDLNDYLAGYGGADKINGGAGDDTLAGGYGRDVLKGGAGEDAFVWHETLGHSNVDTIQDFDPKDDTIKLANIGFVLGSGVLEQDRFHVGSHAHDPSDRLIYDSANGHVYFDADGNGPDKQIEILQLQSALHVTYADFFIG